jgi:hypothetical protein
MADFRRPHHRAVARILATLNTSFLSQAACYFGGGTQLTMAFGEYRESRDIDFLCSSRAGFRLLREEVNDRSLGRVLSRPLHLAREVRSDRDGIRTFLAVDDFKIKFEILLEARIDLTGAVDSNFSVPVLATEHAIAEKLLANTDRGLDDSTLSRDLIDLAFVALHVDKHKLQAGLVIAEQAYGATVQRLLQRSLDSFQNRARANKCIKGLAIDDTHSLRRGLRLLRGLLA